MCGQSAVATWGSGPTLAGSGGRLTHHASKGGRPVGHDAGLGSELEAGGGGVSRVALTMTHGYLALVGLRHLLGLKNETGHLWVTIHIVIGGFKFITLHSFSKIRVADDLLY